MRTMMKISVSWVMIMESQNWNSILIFTLGHLISFLSYPYVQSHERPPASQTLQNHQQDFSFSVIPWSYSQAKPYVCRALGSMVLESPRRTDSLLFKGEMIAKGSPVTLIRIPLPTVLTVKIQAFTQEVWVSQSNLENNFARPRKSGRRLDNVWRNYHMRITCVWTVQYRKVGKGMAGCLSTS